jgi:hypothetical protein
LFGSIGCARSGLDGKTCWEKTLAGFSSIEAAKNDREIIPVVRRRRVIPKNSMRQL